MRANMVRKLLKRTPNPSTGSMVLTGGAQDIDGVKNFTGGIKLNGTTISSSAAEINEIAGRDVVYSTIVSASLAEINAGKVLIPATAGVTLKILDFTAIVVGTFATGTAIVLQDTNGTPVVISTIAAAAATGGAILKPNTTNVTMGAGYLASLTVAKGVQVVKTGSAFTDGTSVKFEIKYTLA